jgi:nitrite reductase/ring-hydroxylating ferredoxin subunit
LTLEPSHTRRAVLCGAAGCLAMAACGSRAGATATTPAPSSPSPASGTSPASPSASSPAPPLAESAAVREDVPLAVTLPDGRPAFLVRGADGVQLLDGTCTHAACAIGWEAGRKHFVCPCHLSTFDLTGRLLTPPATDPLPHIPVREHDGHVYLAG